VAVGSAYQMFLSRDGGQSWHPVTAPMPTPAGTGTGLALAGVAGEGTERVLLAADDGASGRVFLADLPA
jgi:hypothetical protein